LAKVIKGDGDLVFPEGTTVEHLEDSWGMYCNKRLNVTWIGYKVKGGTAIIRLSGVRNKLSRDFQGISAYVKQMSATACGECGG